ncbi:MAG: hypothetical protein ACPG7F_14145, partial [Aggregatilineales bacterium]
MSRLKLMLILVFLFMLPILVNAQSRTAVECGDIIENEFTRNSQPFLFTIDLSAGDSIQASLVPIGTNLSATLGLYAPNDAAIAAGGYDEYWWGYAPSPEPELDSDILSSNGTYTLVVINDTLNTTKTLGDGYGS